MKQREKEMREFNTVTEEDAFFFFSLSFFFFFLIKDLKNVFNLIYAEKNKKSFCE